ncbi:glycosyltransferase [Rossellomorea vietnamensis]|uniref:Glycosyltransferase n=1 Tax=Rossellomorea vietnamensis TaxID=218284 RepID=A0A5D4K5W9_9BACI|nr:glycosyltransferase [Rossellomorea vietnamensis]TYR72622.1 glycosyltransferase [Rossellomorea vietnamensis]
MKFSVLMSVYFKENPLYLEDSLESVVKQSVVPTEIVLVKDGELTKELDDIINHYITNYPSLFKILEFKQNQGLGIALKEGVKACNYDIIARMDTDDIAVSNRFEKQLNIFKLNKEIDIVGSNITEFDKNPENIISIKRVPISDNEIKKYAKRRNPFNHMTVMFRKKAVIDSGNYMPFPLNEDYYLWIRMILNNSKMYNINESLVYARAGSNMFERRGGKGYFYTDIKLQKEYLDLGFINLYEFITNISMRAPVRILPNKMRGWIYMTFLRGKEV